MTDHERYLLALHGMQAGVAVMMHREPNGETSPKHLRVGLNSAMCGQAALVKLLVAKGLFTWEEYYKAVADEMEQEQKRYEARVDPDGRVSLH